MRQKIIVALVSCFIFSLFFFRIFLGQVPFPGDLLLSHYEPYRSYSYDGYNPGAIPTKNQGADVVRELYPWKFLTISQLKLGNFPFWNTNNFSGNPQFANLQSGVLNPVNVLFFMLDFKTAWALYIVAQYIFVFAFTYLYFKSLKISNWASIFGAVAFSFSGFLIVWGEYGNFGYSLCSLPLVLLGIEKLFNEKKQRWGLLVSFSLLASIFAGYIQISLYIFLFALVYISSRAYSLKLHFSVIFQALLFLITPFFIGAVQLVPLYEFVGLSLRSPYTFAELSKWLNSPLNIITLLVPDFFGNPATSNYFASGSVLEKAAFVGVWPLVFAVYSIFSNKSFHKSFFVISAVVIYISSLAVLPVIYFHSIGIPFLSTGVPTRILCIFTFCIAVLAAIGLDEYTKNKNKNLQIKVLAFFAVCFAAILLSTFVNGNSNSLISRRNTIIPLAIFILGSGALIFALFLNKTKKIGKLNLLVTSLIILITIFELFYSFRKYNSFVKKEYIYPENRVVSKLNQIQRIDRYWGYGSAQIDPNLQIMQGNYSPIGYDALYLKRYGQFINGSKKGKLEKKIEHTQALVYQGYGPSDLKNNIFRLRALNILGVKYLLNKKATPGMDSAFDTEQFKLIWERDGFQIYQNLDYLPRISVFGDYEVETDTAKIISKIYKQDFKYKDKIILEKRLSTSYNLKKGSHTISDIKYSWNEVTFRIKLQNDSLVMLTDNNYPGWMAKIDGRISQIYTADNTFRAIAVKKREP